MPRQPAQKPDISITPRPKKPSEWSPRPIPTPGVGRSTEDPRTPTLRELAAREAARASLLAASVLAPPAAPETTAEAPSVMGGPTLPPSPTRAQCQAAWATVQARTRQVLGAGGGDESPRANLTRNRAISAAYAELAQGDPRMRWAGVASVVSTQAHCAMQDADVAVGRTSAAARVAPLLGPVAGGGALTAYGMAAEVQDALYDTNREIFSDIYPAVAMYKAAGLRGVLPRAEGGCGDERPDRPMAPALQDALRQVDAGNVGGGSLSFARYEQTDIVQNRIYEDPRRPLLKSAMRLNQGVAESSAAEAAQKLLKVRKPEVAVSAECGQGAPVPFQGDITVAQHRVRYYRHLEQAYLQRDQAARDAMGRVIASRDPLRGGPDYTYVGLR